MSHEVSQFNSEQNSIALNNASITGGGKMSAEHTPGPRQKGYIWVDDDGFIAHGTGDDYITVAEIIKPEHVEPLTKIIDSHDALLEACKDVYDGSLSELLQYCIDHKIAYSECYLEPAYRIVILKAAIEQAEREG